MAAIVYRVEKLSDSQRAEFVEKATALHKAIEDMSRRLRRPFGPDYTALHEANNSICEAIQAVTGKSPKWMLGKPTSVPFRTPEWRRFSSIFFRVSPSLPRAAPSGRESYFFSDRSRRSHA